MARSPHAARRGVDVGRAVETHRGQFAALVSEGVTANMGVIPPEAGVTDD
jgi:glutamate-1-semialdehyde aminotransferase